MIRLTTICGLALLLAGCGQKPESPPAPPPGAPAPAQATMSAESNAAPRPALTLPPGANLDAELAALTQELRKWSVQHQRSPKNFEEFSASASVQVPAAPPGKKFAISKQMRVVVENQ